MSSPLLEVKDLQVVVGEENKVLLDGLNLTVNAGETHVLMGHNGAGKSTIMNILTGYLAATEGQVTVAGHPLPEEADAAKACVGYLPEQPPLYPEMTVAEYLDFAAELKGVKKADRPAQVQSAAHRTGLEDVLPRLIRSLSKGYRQRVGVAQALLGSPQLIILDEPTVGLDPAQVIEIRNLIHDLGETHTVILSSHILSELANLATCYGFLDNGMMLEQISARALEEKCRACIEARVDDASRAALVLEQSLGIRDYEVLPGHLLRIYSSLDAPHRVAQALVEGGVALQSIESRGANLEDYFLSMIGGVRHA